ncbi:MAG: FAD-binding oxidoreductase [Candidatus Saccharimonadales bacterium]
MSDLKTEIARIFSGEIDDSEATRQIYSHDASLFELKPQLVVYPKNSHDVQNLVKYVANHRQGNPNLYITARSAGTDMSGGSIGEGISVDFTRHLNKIESVDDKEGHVQPGVHYRDFEPATLRHKAWMPSFPASRELCTVGGIVANNSGGELSLSYGKTINFINELKVVLSDGHEYVMKPLDKKELDKKMAQKDFEGRLYKQVFELVDKHYDAIKAAKPHVSKNSTGYNLWDIWDRQTGIFDITKAIVGSQGTLGLVTDIKFRLVPKDPFSGVLVCFLKDTNQLGEIINTVVEQKPASFESFDNYTLNLSIKFFPYFRYNLGWLGLAKLGLQLIPDALILARGIPKLIMLIEFTGPTQQEVTEKLDVMKVLLRK